MKYAGDKRHGGEHWHVFKGNSRKELGRLALDGKAITGNITKKAKKIAKKAGILGFLLITALEIYNAKTATKAEAFEKIMDEIEKWPEELQGKFIEDLLKNNPDFFKEEDIDSSDKDYQ